MKFKSGDIDGVIIKPLTKCNDPRGWLCEMFRQDELHEKFYPVMSYISVTHPNVARGPHEHVDQTDIFGFIGPSTFKVYMWDNRKNSPTYGFRKVVHAGEEEPKFVLIPPGVVHAYRNVGGVLGTVANFPHRLYAGKEKKEKVDEIRHESDTQSLYRID